MASAASLKPVGAWGTGIFSDDLAADVRAEWRNALLEGRGAQDITRDLVAKYEVATADPDESIVLWLALAAAQMETGRLDPAIRDRALAIIDAGGDVARWSAEDEGLAKQRRRVLDRLAAKLRGPQTKPKKLRPPRPLAARFDLGDIILVRNTAAQREALFVVVDQMEYPRGNIHPVLEGLLWDGGDVPRGKALQQLPSLLTSRSDPLVGTDVGLRPHMIVATTHRRTSVFTSGIGAVVERGVRRPASADYRESAGAIAPVVTSYMEWPVVVRWIGGPAFRNDLETTRRQYHRA